jgi:hypothetical protein
LSRFHVNGRQEKRGFGNAGKEITRLSKKNAVCSTCVSTSSYGFDAVKILSQIPDFF